MFFSILLTLLRPAAAAGDVCVVGESYAECVNCARINLNDCNESNISQTRGRMEACEDYEDDAERTQCEKDVTAEYKASKIDCKEKHTLAVNGCKESWGSSSGGGMADPETSCPPGTVLDVLGRCVVPLEAEVPDDLIPDDGCPAGTTRGPDDDCVPLFFTGEVVPASDDLWFFVCPPGSSPGPIDGCVPDLGNDGTDPDDDDPGWSCPPGMAPGPDDGCVPLHEVMETGPAFAAALVRDMAAVGMDAVEDIAMSFDNVCLTEDVEATIEATLESLETGLE